MMTSYRPRFVLALTAFAVLAAGTVLATQVFSGRTAPANAPTVAATENAAAVTAAGWNETGRKGSAKAP